MKKTKLANALNVLQNLTESRVGEAEFKTVNLEIMELRALLLEAYKNISCLRESGDAGFWDETELEKSLKKKLGIK